MDDDFSFGTSIWASSTSETPNGKPTSSTKELPLAAVTPPPQSDADFENDAFGDNDFEFQTPPQPSASMVEEDDFGDFGDFGEAVEGDVSEGFTQSSTFTNEDPFTPQSSAGWETLRLDPLPSKPTLKAGIGDILQPLWDTADASEFLTDDNIRQVEGLNQILVTPESRGLYNTLYQTSPPNTQPPNWTRSRIRRRHLVSLGIPVNLDEVLPSVNGKALPALNITTRPMSAPPGSRALNRVASPPPASSSASRPGSRPGSRPPSRAATPKASPLSRSTATFAQLGLGPPPEVDEAAVNEVISISPETFTLLPLSTLEARLTHVRSLTASTSALLTYLLQQRDALQQDSETYNKLIAELVGEAQKMKTGAKTRNGGSRRASGMA
ncbi:uncharacterized protein FOMMEDRAFT_126619 [Fomitiporia mediterranea MF3/22]|uniref:uncharacterized protein n=1 Tax=Fomitiporia mediterranea (strain MF3/22) TaxID=694068 RepID=UPI0004408686|nr:uncharacterized protein FOMMEDRAFT_126619 [Fomitiporia mediterranea MF3/22]EJD01576.1 hypothetical protein FOMMEDRAFT_126619 [Fomitiporia mediterranea MF3/22]